MAVSVPHALIVRYESISAGAFPGGIRPPVYLGEAPISSAGQTVRPPYVVVTDEGMRPQHYSDDGALETARVRVEVYHTDLGLLDQIVQAVRHGSGQPKDRQGLDWALWSATGPYVCVQAMRTDERREYAGWDYQGLRVHRCVLAYEVQWHLTGGT